jgi:hypothetical protein
VIRIACSPVHTFIIEIALVAIASFVFHATLQYARDRHGVLTYTS